MKPLALSCGLPGGERHGSTVKYDAGAVDVAGVVGEQEGGGVRNVDGFTQAAYGDALANVGVNFFFGFVPPGAGRG